MLTTFKRLPKFGKLGVAAGILTVWGLIGAAAGTSSSTQVQLQTTPTSHTSSAVLGTETTHAQTQASSVQTPAKPVIKTSVITETQPIPFQSTTVATPALAKGVNRITTAGVNGTTTLTYTVTTTDGVQTSKVLTNQTVTSAPITQVTSVGTYVAPASVAPPVQPSCPNGTYVNSAGSTVCSPYVSNSAPAGATAQCRDSSYSFSQSRSGTCSHHGGVASWL